jgi:hypothetical protein
MVARLLTFLAYLSGYVFVCAVEALINPGTEVCWFGPGPGLWLRTSMGDRWYLPFWGDCCR